MALNITHEISNGISKITLSGRLDAATAPLFKAEVEKAAAGHANTVVLLIADLEYMASAGLRVLVFAKQKMGSEAKIFIIGAQDMVKQTIELSGFHQAVTILDKYDPSVIEIDGGK